MDINRALEPKCLNLFGKFWTKSTYKVANSNKSEHLPTFFPELKEKENYRDMQQNTSCNKAYNKPFWKPILHASESLDVGLRPLVNLLKWNQMCKCETNGECVLFKVVTIPKWSAMVQCAINKNRDSAL